MIIWGGGGGSAAGAGGVRVAGLKGGGVSCDSSRRVLVSSACPRKGLDTKAEAVHRRSKTLGFASLGPWPGWWTFTLHQP